MECCLEVLWAAEVTQVMVEAAEVLAAAVDSQAVVPVEIGNENI